jgi:hypothetical protein
MALHPRRLSYPVVSLLQHNSIKTYGGVNVRLHAFLISEIDTSEWTSLNTRGCEKRTDLKGLQEVRRCEKTSEEKR